MYGSLFVIGISLNFMLYVFTGSVVSGSPDHTFHFILFIRSFVRLFIYLFIYVHFHFLVLQHLYLQILQKYKWHIVSNFYNEFYTVKTGVERLKIRTMAVS